MIVFGFGSFSLGVPSLDGSQPKNIDLSWVGLAYLVHFLLTSYFPPCARYSGKIAGERVGVAFCAGHRHPPIFSTV
jgi:hypothetical protein